MKKDKCQKQCKLGKITSSEYFDKTQLIGGLSGLAKAVAVIGAVGHGEQHAEAERHPLEPTEPGLGRHWHLWRQLENYLANVEIAMEGRLIWGQVKTLQI